MARAIDKRIMLDLIIEAKKTDPETCPFSEWLAEYLVDHLPTLTPPNEWVSVDKKLPQCGVPVLIGNPHWDYPVVASYAGSGVWMDSWHQKMTFTPTCWMPLPAPFNRRPPEGEEDT